MATSLKQNLATVFLCLFAASAAFGQNVAPELNITLGEQRVKFAPTRSFQEMRLEVLNSVGEIVFTHLTADAEFDWNLRAGNSEALAPGLYRYTLALKFGADQARQHTGHFIVEKGQDQVWLTASEGTEVSGTVLSASRSGGRSITGLGSKDDKSVKRDVSGREIVNEKGDEKGNKLTGSTKAVKAALLGTANMVPKYDVGGVNLIDSAITEVGGNVGIGITTPTSILEMVRPTVSDVVFKMQNATRAWSVGVSGSGDFWRIRDNSAGAARLAVTGGTGLTGGYVGIGTTAPAAKLDVFGDIRSSALRQELTASSPNVINGFIGTGSGGATPGNRVTAGVEGASIGGGGFNGMLSFPGGGSLTGDNSNRVTDWFGTVGGGVKNRAGNDDAALGNAKFATVGGGQNNTAHGHATVGGGSSNTASGGFSTVGGGSSNIASGIYATVPGGVSNTAIGYASFAAGTQAKANHQGAFVWGDSNNTDFGSTANDQFLIRAAGGVGIGLNNPGGFRLNVYNAGSEGLRVATDTAGGRVASFGGSGTFEIDAPFVGGGRLTVLENGNVGIGATNPAYKLVVGGDSCSNNYPCASDARLKEQVTDLRYGLRQLLQLRPVSWKWKDAAEQQLPLGLIAQEVEPVMPELVMHPAQASGSLGLNYMGLLPVMVKATQEQQAQIQAQQTQIQQLLQANQQTQQLNRSLRQRLSQLERRVKARRR